MENPIILTVFDRFFFSNSSNTYKGNSVNIEVTKVTKMTYIYVKY